MSFFRSRSLREAASIEARDAAIAAHIKHADEVLAELLSKPIDWEKLNYVLSQHVLPKIVRASEPEASRYARAGIRQALEYARRHPFHASLDSSVECCESSRPAGVSVMYGLTSSSILITVYDVGTISIARPQSADEWDELMALVWW